MQIISTTNFKLIYIHVLLYFLILLCSLCFCIYRELWRPFGDRPDYGGFESNPARDDVTMRQHMVTIQKATNASARTQCESLYGIRYTELVRLPYFDLVNFHIIDPMHNMFLGTAKNMLKWIWPNENGLTRSQLDSIQQQVDQTIVPPEVGRIPHKIASCFANFTSDKLKNWTLYYSSFCMKPVLPDASYRCWMLFVEACHTFCQPVLHIRDISRGHELMMRFCRMFEDIYGSDKVMPNMHLHTHILDYIMNYGTFNAFWLFAFERLNGTLASYFTNQKSVEVQVMRKCTSISSWAHYNTHEKYADIFILILKKTLPTKELTTPTFINKDVFYLIRGPLTVGIENYYLLDATYTLGRRSNGIMDTSDLSHFKQSLATISPEVDSDKLSPCYNEYCTATFAKYTSLQSPNSRLSYIQARWCGDDGNIDSSGDSCRPGQIMYFLHMFVPVKESQECLPLVFAYIRWYQKHDGRDSYESPSVSVWAKNVFEPDGPASFIPIQRIKGRIITGLVTWRGEVVRVTIPQISRNYWWIITVHCYEHEPYVLSQNEVITPLHVD